MDDISWLLEYLPDLILFKYFVSLVLGLHLFKHCVSILGLYHIISKDVFVEFKWIKISFIKLSILVSKI